MDGSSDEDPDLAEAGAPAATPTATPAASAAGAALPPTAAVVVGTSAAAPAPPPPPPPPLAPAPAPAPAGPAAAPRPPRNEQPLQDLTAPCWAGLDDLDLLAEFKSDCPTLRVVPKAARAVAADVTEELCKALLRAGDGTLEERRAWKLLLLRERLLFLAPLRLTSGRRRNTEERLDLGRLVRSRASALLRGEWEDLLADARATSSSLTRSRTRSGPGKQDESYLADAVVRKVLADEHSRAAALLASPGLAPLTEETAAKLQQLLQPSTAPALAHTERPTEAPPAPFSRKTAKQALRSSPKGSGAAVGGGRFEHWRVVLASPTALAAYHEVLFRVATGRVPEDAA